MSVLGCRFVSTALAFGAAVLLISRLAVAQACCAGAAALTPGRLALHEAALAGVQLKAGLVYGSYAPSGTYRAAPSGINEQNFEQDLLGAVRVLSRGQLALLVPFVETRRATTRTTSYGGGLGDVNLSARYDFIDAGSSRYVPGIALLLGVTLPTGTPPESASQPLATDATGEGAVQLNGGIALEQLFDSWLFNLTVLVAQRLARTADGVSERLGTELTGLLGAAYTFESSTSLAAFASYSSEGDATVDGARVADSGRRALLLGIAVSFSPADTFRLQASVFGNLPVSGFGANQPASVGLGLSAVYGWLS